MNDIYWKFYEANCNSNVAMLFITSLLIAVLVAMFCGFSAFKTKQKSYLIGALLCIAYAMSAQTLATVSFMHAASLADSALKDFIIAISKNEPVEKYVISDKSKWNKIDLSEDYSVTDSAESRGHWDYDVSFDNDKKYYFILKYDQDHWNISLYNITNKVQADGENAH